MKNQYFSKFIFVILFTLISVSLFAQIQVGLDNWFNRETDKKTGKPYHYLWSDTAWSGFSELGKLFEKNSAKLSLLNRPTIENLAAIQIYILVDTDTIRENPSPNYILEEDSKIIENWVKGGGVLMVLANDSLNCEFSHLNQFMKRFGITFDHVLLHPVLNKNYDMGAFINLPKHPVFKDVNKIFLKEIASLTISKKVKPVLEENGKVFIAERKFGKGFVFAVGDPWIYNEYIDHERLPKDFENLKAAENLVKYLLSKVKK